MQLEWKDNTCMSLNGFESLCVVNEIPICVHISLFYMDVLVECVHYIFHH